MYGLPSPHPRPVKTVKLESGSEAREGWVLMTVDPL